MVVYFLGFRLILRILGFKQIPDLIPIQCAQVSHALSSSLSNAPILSRSLAEMASTAIHPRLQVMEIVPSVVSAHARMREIPAMIVRMISTSFLIAFFMVY